MTNPQENQPGEANPQNLVGSEPQAECHTPPNVEDGVMPARFHLWADDTGRTCVSSEDFDAERAKRLELEGAVATAKRANQLQFDKLQDVQSHLRKSEAELAAAIGMSLHYEQRANDLLAIAQKSERELLELRAKVGQPVTNLTSISNKLVGGPEAKADGGSRPTSARCPDCGGLGFVIGAPIDYPQTGHAYSKPVTCGKCWGTGILHDSGGSEAETGGPTSPEPAAIPKTTKAWEDAIVKLMRREMDDHERAGYGWGDNDVFAINAGAFKTFFDAVAVREVTGEGRKVSAAAIELLEIMKSQAADYSLRLNLYGDPSDEQLRTQRYTLDERVALINELLCVLSEEGGRQKEGGTEAEDIL